MSQLLLRHYAIDADIAESEAATLRVALRRADALIVFAMVARERELCGLVELYVGRLHERGELEASELEEWRKLCAEARTIATRKIDEFRATYGADYTKHFND